MRKLKLYIATSLDGKIAKPDGNVDWLDEVPNPDESDYGYYDFYATIDTTLQGYKTYEFILNLGVDFPYPDKTNFVFTRKQNLPPNEHVSFVSEDIVAFTRKLKEEEGKDIWLIGGGQINTALFNADLIDEMYIHVMPIVIGDGIPLFGPHPDKRMFSLIESHTEASGAIMLRYAR